MQGVSTAPPAALRLFLAIDGQPQGPFDLSQVQARLAAGIVTPDTLICPDGGGAWVRVQDFLATLPPPRPPASPPGSVPAPGLAQTRQAPATGAAMVFGSEPRTRAAPSRRDQTLGWEIGLLFAVVVMAFMGWVKFGDQDAYAQSGIHAITGDLSINGTTENANSLGGILLGQMKEAGMPPAPLCTLAAACLTVALVLSVMGRLRRMAGIASLATAALLILQAVLGFPQERQVAQFLEHHFATLVPTTFQQDPRTTKEAIEIEQVFARLRFQPHYSIVFYGTIAALAMAGVMAVLASRKSNQER